jgi:predicted transposase YbfD/YdcC
MRHSFKIEKGDHPLGEVRFRELFTRWRKRRK